MCDMGQWGPLVFISFVFGVSAHEIMFRIYIVSLSENIIL